MKQEPVIRDERYFAVENASYKIGYLILSFGTMLLISFRGFVYKESNWDFFALVMISSLAATIYQYKHRIVPFSRKLLVTVIALTLLSAGIAYVMVRLILRK